MSTRKKEANALSQVTSRWGHAIVVGAGFGGLLAARVLSDYFERVTVLEQDFVTVNTGQRSGVPQARHVHALLARGSIIVEELFPGVSEELAAMGAPVFDLAQHGRVLLPTGWAPRFPIGLPIQTFTRVALEQCLRQRVMQLRGVTITSGFRVTGLLLSISPGRKTVDGVRGRFRDSPANPGIAGQEEVFEADLVVNASGKTSALRTWLTEAGIRPPSPRIVEGNLSYSSRCYSMPQKSSDSDWRTTAELTYAPTIRCGGVINEVEGRRWLVTLIGADGEKTPVDENGFLEYVRTLRNPLFAQCVENAVPIGPIYRAVKLNNSWTPYHRMWRWPDRLVCVGDAICTLNPVYGQGMTVAAVQVKALRGCLEKHRERGELAGMARKFQKSAARATRIPWIMATSSDLAWTSRKNRPVFARLTHWYFDRLLDVMPVDSPTYQRFSLTAQALRGPAGLAHPHTIVKILRLSLRRTVRGRMKLDLS
ncbi:FAD-dependent oxidoreductase [Streptomyces sp. NPDC088560]|uniref:FAD-dependent oxidoreductase n=1 Tax=Streptomyces sp. NPDC088560 TaxID=3365868 RepID=UPI0038144178